MDREKDAPDGLRRLYAAGASARVDDHLDHDAWERLACHEMEPAERERAVDHVARCPECARVYRGLLMLEDEARAFDPGVPAPPAVGRMSLRPRWYAAAALAAGLTAVILVPLRRGADVGVSSRRSAGSPASLTLLDPLGELKSPPERFRWEAVPRADSYRVRLYREDGLPVWTSGDLASPTVDRPPSLSLAPGRYFWQVTALRDGEPLAESTLSPFAVSP